MAYDETGAGAYWDTKDSGHRRQFESGMQRDRGDSKERFYLILPKIIPYEHQMLTRWAGLMTRGAEKYSDRNWELATTEEELDEFIESAWRHLGKWTCGKTDEDHAAAVFFNVAGAEMVRWKLENGTKGK